MRLVLGSGSPRRLELLAQIGVVPAEVRPPNIDETPEKGEVPRQYVRRMAREKARAVPCAEGEVVLCADTTVAMGRRIMGKPEDAAKAASFLYMMSGRRHRVITAVAVKRDDEVFIKDVMTTVQMKRLSNAEVNSYLSSGDWKGKAGGYGIQGPAGAFIPWINGSFTSVVGLPLAETASLLIAAGYPIYQEVSE
ncbi:MAG: septum formation inhibitor Maf [Marivivens sp.]|nr:septum formation inhibitor Maf [Marivivens sp.]